MTQAAQGAEALTITAPFAGRIETLDLKAGEFVSLGSDVGRLVDITPLTVAIQAPQQSLTHLKECQQAVVKFMTGEECAGTVTFVGISAEVIIPTGEATAHFLSPSVVSLDSEATLASKRSTRKTSLASSSLKWSKRRLTASRSQDRLRALM